MRREKDTDHAHLDVGALTGEGDGETSHFLGGVGDRLGAVDQILLRAALTANELRETRHENGHPLGGGDDVVLMTRPLLQLLQRASSPLSDYSLDVGCGLH